MIDRIRLVLLSLIFAMNLVFVADVTEVEAEEVEEFEWQRGALVETHNTFIYLAGSYLVENGEMLSYGPECLEYTRWKNEWDRTHVDMGEFLITVYCPCHECSDDYGVEIAYDGVGHKYAKPNHTIAVDPNWLPYGTKVEIEGFDGIQFVAEDCGGAVNNNHIDIFIDHHDDSFRERRNVWIVKE